jgi:ankyrin repeat protein
MTDNRRDKLFGIKYLKTRSQKILEDKFRDLCRKEFSLDRKESSLDRKESSLDQILTLKLSDIPIYIISEGFVLACSNGNLELVIFFLNNYNNGNNNHDFNKHYGFYEACKNGKLDVIKYFFDNVEMKKYILDQGFKGAYEGNHKEVIDILYKQYPEPEHKYLRTSHFNYCLRGAVEGGHIDVVKSLMQHTYMSVMDLGAACSTGNMEMLKIISSEFSDVNEYNYGLTNACVYGQIEAAKYMISLGANYYNDGLWHSCNKGHLDLVKYMISLGANNFDRSLWSVCAYNEYTPGRYNIAKYLLNLWKPSYECIEYIIEDIISIEILLLLLNYVNPDINDDLEPDSDFIELGVYGLTIKSYKLYFEYIVYKITNMQKLSPLRRILNNDIIKDIINLC